MKKNRIKKKISLGIKTLDFLKLEVWASVDLMNINKQILISATKRLKENSWVAKKMLIMIRKLQDLAIIT